jgi:hypothetical protein
MRKVVVTLEIYPQRSWEAPPEEMLRSLLDGQFIEEGSDERIVSIEVEAHPDDDFGDDAD